VSGAAIIRAIDEGNKHLLNVDNIYQTTRRNIPEDIFVLAAMRT
jgi:hypothetical protein